MVEVVTYDAKAVMGNIIEQFMQRYKTMKLDARITSVTYNSEGEYLGCEVVVSPRDKRIFPVTLITRYGIIKARSQSGERMVWDNVPTEMLVWFDTIAVKVCE